MQDLLPADPRARRLALTIWAVLAVIGSVAVWWLASYLDSLTALEKTDREGALALFRARVMPALLAVVGVAVVAGALVMRQGLQIVRTVRKGDSASGSPGRGFGRVLAALGFILAATPLVLISIMFWLLRRA